MKTSRIVVYGVLLVGGLAVLAVQRLGSRVEADPTTAPLTVPARPLKPLTPRLVADKLETLADLRASRFEQLESQLTVISLSAFF